MIVLDSSFLVAHRNERDVHHEAAVRIMSRLLGGEWNPVLLPEYVFLEVVTVIAARRGVDEAVRAGEDLLRASEIQIVPCSDHFASTVEAFRDLGRLGLSFADAAIVVITRAFGARHVATFDRDFAKVDGLSIVDR